MKEFTHFIVHHSAGPRDQSVASIRAFHKRPKEKGGRGWSDIGYHWIIDGDGVLHIGRRIPTQGAHAPPNAGRLGCLVTGDNTDPDQAWVAPQIVTLRAVWASVEMLMPWLELEGHRDVMRPGYTECPGVDVRALLLG